MLAMFKKSNYLISNIYFQTGFSALSWEREKHSSEKTQHSLNNSQLSSLQHTHLLANSENQPFTFTRWCV